ncbi:MAG: C40 family peptidase [Rhodocyclaceae bacterium]|nr:C40 family peptidase [Rhodocyclaceae bacterium]
MKRPHLGALLASLWLAACSVLTPHPQVGAGDTAMAAQTVPEAAREVVLSALGLLETGYRFGGRNPEAGLDCSGMVNFVYHSAVQRRLGSSAADMATRGMTVASGKWRAGDLVFFNTRGAPHSHVGIYLGEQRFIHAPSTKGKVRIDRLDTGWFAPRLTEVRRYLE